MTVKLLLILASSFYLLTSIADKPEPVPIITDVYRPYMKEKVREMGLKNETNCVYTDITLSLLQIEAFGSSE